MFPFKKRSPAFDLKPKSNKEGRKMTTPRVFIEAGEILEGIRICTLLENNGYIRTYPSMYSGISTADLGKLRATLEGLLVMGNVENRKVQLRNGDWDKRPPPLRD